VLDLQLNYQRYVEDRGQQRIVERQPQASQRPWFRHRTEHRGKHEDITVGSPSGSVPITINGRSPPPSTSTAPRESLRPCPVSGGAVNLTFDGRQSHAIGTVTAQTSGYNSASDRYQIQSTAEPQT